MRSIGTTQRALAAMGALVLAGTLSACILRGDIEASRAQNSSGSATADSSGSDGSAGKPAGRDLSAGGECADGEDAYINGSNLDVAVTGNCGNVRVEGSNIVASIELATSIAIRGESNTVSGQAWDNVVIQGVNLSAETETAGAIETNGKNIDITSGTTGALLITGEGITATTGNVKSIDLTGTKLSVSAQEVAEFIVAEGSNNSVEWTGGIDKENASSGENNVFTRK